MFRYNNPDALLVLLLVIVLHGAGHRHRVGGEHDKWMALTGGAVGFAAFLTKMLQAFWCCPASGWHS